MKREPVSSSTIASIGYDPDSQTLEIQFLNGSVYLYFWRSKFGSWRTDGCIVARTLLPPAHTKPVRGSRISSQGSNRNVIIESVRVQNFRCIKDETLPCDRLTVLGGPKRVREIIVLART